MDSPQISIFILFTLWEFSEINYSDETIVVSFDWLQESNIRKTEGFYYWKSSERKIRL